MKSLNWLSKLIYRVYPGIIATSHQDRGASPPGASTRRETAATPSADITAAQEGVVLPKAELIFTEGTTLSFRHQRLSASPLISPQSD